MTRITLSPSGRDPVVEMDAVAGSPPGRGDLAEAAEKAVGAGSATRSDTSTAALQPPLAAARSSGAATDATTSAPKPGAQAPRPSWTQWMWWRNSQDEVDGASVSTTSDAIASQVKAAAAAPPASDVPVEQAASDGGAWWWPWGGKEAPAPETTSTADDGRQRRPRRVLKTRTRRVRRPPRSST